MTTHDFQTSIHIEGLLNVIQNLGIYEKRRLPSTSQWHRLREVALTGGIKDTRRFLDERPSKKKAAGKWTFNVKGRPFYKVLQQLLLDPIEKAQNIGQMGENMPFTMFTSPLNHW